MALVLSTRSMVALACSCVPHLETLEPRIAARAPRFVGADDEQTGGHQNAALPQTVERTFHLNERKKKNNTKTSVSASPGTHARTPTLRESASDSGRERDSGAVHGAPKGIGAMAETAG